MAHLLLVSGVAALLTVGVEAVFELFFRDRAIGGPWGNGSGVEFVTEFGIGRKVHCSGSATHCEFSELPRSLVIIEN